MSPQPHDTRDQAAVAALAKAQELMDAIESALRQHLAGTGLMDAAAGDEIARRIQQLTRAIRAIRPADAAACTAQLRRIQTLHTRLALRLEIERQEAAADLARLRRGKATLRAYGRSA
jgi:hypothetical protein